MSESGKGETPATSPKKHRATLTPAEQEVIAFRRDRVAECRLRKMTQRDIVKALMEEGLKNPDTQEPWSLGTINADIQALRREWRAQALEKTELLRGELIAELRKVRQVAWAGGMDEATMKTLTGLLADPSAMVRAEALKAISTLAQPNLMAVLASAKQEADLLGLEAPKQINHGGTVARVNFTSDDAVAARGAVQEWQRATFGVPWDPTAPPPG